MWKRMKESFVAGFKRGFRRKKKGGFTGFRVELYRDGVLIRQQLGTVYNNMEYSFPHCAVKIDGVLLHRYRLITEVENYSDRRGLN